MTEAFQTVTKIEAARRQLEEAIELHFERRDPIAIHALTAAAQQILRDLAKREGKGNILHDNPHVRQERRGEWVASINAAQNFFKHADRDPEATLKFRPSTTTFYLVDAIYLHYRLAGEQFWAGRGFLAWFSLKYAGLLWESEVKKRAQELLRDGMGPEDYPIFLELLRLPPGKRGESSGA